ncbi:MAG: zinc ribbon domain-containing protein [Actinomycetota bacterium]|nr:zinc ribbon domain-containing protein [Actinomycetota bacterium]
METSRTDIHEETSTHSQGGSFRCPACGAGNRAEAPWCGQCYTKFESSTDGGSAAVGNGSTEKGRVAPPPPPRSEPTRPSGLKPGKAGAFEVTEEGINWTCLRCDSVNDLESNLCSVCGATFADAIKPPEKPRPARDANMAALVSLFMPGAGHAYVGMWGQGIARGIISLWVVTVTIFSGAQGAPQAKIMAALFGLVGLGLWAVAAHDAYREASNNSRAVVLKQKYFLYLVLGLLMLSIVMVFSIALGARG